MILGVKNREELTEFAYNGKEAFQAVQNDPNKYALIMMDCNMPFMDGCQASKKIKSLYKSLDIEPPKIMGVTGHVE